MRFPRLAAAALVSIFGAASWSLGQTPAPDDQMRKDIEALKEGQKAIQKDLEEIKKLLLARPVADALPREPIGIADEPFKGDGKARVAVIEFSDYQCPFCGRYVTNTFSQIENDYVETGKVKYVFRDLPLEFHKNAFKASMSFLNWSSPVGVCAQPTEEAKKIRAIMAMEAA